ncbi:MAG: amidoligase family protein [Planctomycetes bacterium]|nr:amidoligase family protein [Planctomycetota bacterium]
MNRTCGLHVHLGAASVAGGNFDEVADWVRRLINATAQHEKAFYGAAGTRERERGSYCRSIKAAWGGKKDRLKRPLKADDLRLEASGIGRYQTLNLVPLFGRNRTVEFRCFSGTINSHKITAWVQMALAVATLALARNTAFDAPATTYADIVLTMDHYTHTLIEDERAALDRLPAINATRATVAALAATGT